MTQKYIENDGFLIRESLIEQLDLAWTRLASPGTWWTGAERLAIADEIRRAETCPLCQARKQALSPYQVAGSHAATDLLPLDAIDAIHRLRTDAGRITQSWLDDLLRSSDTLPETHYVEIVSIVAIVTALDTFDDALGRPRRDLPVALPGTPTGRLPKGATRDLAWVKTLAPDQVRPDDPNPYPVHGDKNIHRSVSLVPQEVFNFFDLDVELYLKDHEIRDFETDYRAISHAQIELIAARASVLNNCYY